MKTSPHAVSLSSPSVPMVASRSASEPRRLPLCIAVARALRPPDEGPRPSWFVLSHAVATGYMPTLLDLHYKES